MNKTRRRKQRARRKYVDTTLPSAIYLVASGVEFVRTEDAILGTMFIPAGMLGPNDPTPPFVIEISASPS